MSSWRSKSLPWIALGSVIGVSALMRFGGDGDRQILERQNTYASRAACAEDYNEDQCQRSGGYYYGPRFYPDDRRSDDPGPGRTAENGRSTTAMSVNERQVSSARRGGFGETARSGGYRGYGG